MSMADQDDATAAVVEGLKRLYHTKLKPLEQTYMFGWFHSPPLTDSEFESKPQVLMCGQYSTGKTSVSVSVCVFVVVRSFLSLFSLNCFWLCTYASFYTWYQYVPVYLEVKHYLVFTFVVFS